MHTVVLVASAFEALLHWTDIYQKSLLLGSSQLISLSKAACAIEQQGQWTNCIGRQKQP